MATLDIVGAFGDIEDELIKTIFGEIRKSIEKDKKPNANTWYTRQLKSMEAFRASNPGLFAKEFAEINARIEADIRKAYADASKAEQDRIVEMIKRGYASAGKRSKPHGINRRKLNALVRFTEKEIKKAEKSMIRRAFAEYRKILFNASVGYNTGSLSLEQAIDKAAHDFLVTGISCVEYANGARHTVRTYSEMALRTANRQASLQGAAEARDEYGIRTVMVTRNSSPCPLCEPFVGKVFYDDVFSGSEVPKDRKYPLLSRAVSRGLFHPNCTDGLSTYYEGITRKPKTVSREDQAKAEELYKKTQQQRYNERNIRKYKRLSENALDPDAQATYKDRLQYWEDRNAQLIANTDELVRSRRREKA